MSINPNLSPIKAEYTEKLNAQGKRERAETSAELSERVESIFDKIIYPNGDLYFGEIVSGTPNGIGKKELKNSTMILMGEFKNGILIFGRKRFPNRDEYVGEWKDEKPNGQGTFTKDNGEWVYTGNWKDGATDNQGTLRDKLGIVYDGGWKDGRKHGYGTLTDEKTGRVLYKGDWENGLQHGRGTSTDENGNHWTGQWEYGEKV